MSRNVEKQPRLTLAELGSVVEQLRNRKETQSETTDIDVLRAIATGKRDLAKKIATNPELLRKFASEQEILRELDALEKLYGDQIQTIEAGEKFSEKTKQEGWGTWAWEKIKSAVSFPKRHPIIALALLAAVAGGAATYLGYLPDVSLALKQWMEKLKALWKLRFGAGGSVGGGAAAAEGGKTVADKAMEAAKDLPLSIRTFGQQVEYAGKIYDMKDLPSLIDKFPALQPGQLVRILRDSDSKATLEIELRRLLTEKYGDDFLIEWDRGGKLP